MRYAIHPEDFKSYTTEKIREAFLLPALFVDNTITHYYSHYDRLIVGGAAPTTKPLRLEPIAELKAAYYLERREIGIINVGAPTTISVNGDLFDLKFKEALYIGKNVQEVVFHPA